MGQQGPSGCTNPSQLDTTGAGVQTIWSNLTNIEVQDGSSATAVMSVNFASSISQAILAQGFGFSIPSNATITGILATIVRGVTNVFTDGVIADFNVQLLKAGTEVGNDKRLNNLDWPTTLTAQNYGASNDLWGASWTPSDINNSGFGLQLQVGVGGSVGGSSGATANVDFISLTIFFTTPAQSGSISLGVTAGFTPGETATFAGAISLGVSSGFSPAAILSTVQMNIVLGVTGTIKTDGGQTISLSSTLGLSGPGTRLVTGSMNATLGITGGFGASGTKLVFSPPPPQPVPCPVLSPLIYTNLITSEHNKRPNFMATVADLVQPFIDLQNQLLCFFHFFDLDLAVGDQLDKIGQWVGVSRNIPIPLTGVFFSWGIVGLGWGQGVWAGVGTPTPVSGTRIQSSGGTQNIKYQLDLGPGVRGTQYSFSVFVKNQGTAPVKVTVNAGGLSLGSVKPGVTALLSGSLFESGSNCGVGVPCNIQMRFETNNVADPIDVVAYLPLISANNGPNLVAGLNLIFAGAWANFFGSVITLTQNVPLVINSVSTSLSVLNDQNFRTLLRARIAANFWDGTVPGIYNIWAIVFALENFQVLIQDNQNMTMTVILLTSALIDAVSLALVTNGLIIPRPAGVLITGYIQTQAPIFGWGLSTPLVQGWGLGSWI